MVNKLIGHVAFVDTFITNSRGLTTVEMKSQESFTDWDFNDVWIIDPDINDGYPYLRSFLQAPYERGGLKGTVMTKEGTPIENVSINIHGSSSRVFTDVNGGFYFHSISVDLVNIVAIKEGYIAYGSEGILLAANETITHSFMMELEASDLDVEISTPSQKLYSNFPNPFNPSTTIRFEVQGSRFVSIEVFNIRGQHVKTLVDGYFEDGIHSVVWDGIDHQGISVPSGIYFYRLETNTGSEVRRMVLMK